LLAPQYINEHDAFEAILKSYLAQANIARKLLPEYREGENAGKKDIKIIGDYKKKRQGIGKFGPKDLGAYFGISQSVEE
jgi:hypothetical protein